MSATGLTLILVTAAIFSIVGVLYSLGKRFSIEDYTTARNTIGLAGLVATLVASSMGAWILFSPAEATATNGIIALTGYALGSAAALFAFAYLGARIRKVIPQGHTITEYIFHRYGKGMYLIVILIALFYMAVFLTAELTGIALAGNMVFNVPLVYTAAIIGIGTLAYTAFGGLRASIFTDKIQTIVIFPLLAVIFIASLLFLGGFAPVVGNVNKANPELFEFSHYPGMEFALTLIIAIIGAGLFNNANWQRVYAAKNKIVMQRGFLLSGLIVFPIVFIVGFFGFFAVGAGAAQEPSVAMFTFLLEVVPEWILLTAMILGIALVMSSMDSLLNGIVSLFTIDMARLKPKLGHSSLLSIGKWFTVVLAGLAILISTKGYSVLYLFLVADLVCVGAAFPAVYGLFAGKFSGRSALIASIAGILAGAYFFPDPSFTRGNLFWSFLAGLIVSILLSLILSIYDKKFNLEILQKKVSVIGR